MFALLLTGLLATYFSDAREKPAENPYAAGCACHEQLDFACAIDLLTVAAHQTDPRDQTRLIDIHRRLAESFLALGRRSEAVATFEALLKIDPAYSIESPGVSPKILDALSVARQNLAQKTTPPAEKPDAPAWLELGLAAGAELLVGQDRRLLRTGPVFELEGNYILPGPWRLGLGLRYTFHEVSASGSLVHAAGGWVSLGMVFRIGSFHLGGHLGLGTEHFGVAGEDSKTGMLIPLRVCASLELSQDVRIGLLAEPGWLLTFDSGARSSFTASVGARLVLAL